MLVAWLLVTTASSAAFRVLCRAFSATVAVMGHKYLPYVTPAVSSEIGVAHTPHYRKGWGWICGVHGGITEIMKGMKRM
jgi:hypothetical protein